MITMEELAKGLHKVDLGGRLVLNHREFGRISMCRTYFDDCQHMSLELKFETGMYIYCEYANLYNGKIYFLAGHVPITSFKFEDLELVE